jgi:hypothetical protein
VRCDPNQDILFKKKKALGSKGDYKGFLGFVKG